MGSIAKASVRIQFGRAEKRHFIGEPTELGATVAEQS